jgi:hypothetical protein
MLLISKRGETVGDFCSGCGSVAYTMAFHGRNVVVVERDKDQIDFIIERFKEHKANMYAFIKPVVVPDRLMLVHADDERERVAGQKVASECRYMLPEVLMNPVNPGLDESSPWELLGVPLGSLRSAFQPLVDAHRACEHYRVRYTTCNEVKSRSVGCWQ